MHCGFLLEVPQWGASNGSINICFCGEIRKIKIHPGWNKCLIKSYVTKWLALLTSDYEVLGSNSATGRIQLMTAWHFIAQLLRVFHYHPPSGCDIQSTLVSSNSLISNNRLSRSENLVPVLTQRATKRQQNIVEKRRNCSLGAISPLFHNIFKMSLT